MLDGAGTDARRRDRFAVLARCDFTELEQRFRTLDLDPDVTFLRPVETGLVMLRGRAGGTGAAFNIGEATVTRASVRLGDGRIGHSVALGRDRKRATLAAVVDALASDADEEIRVEEAIIAPLRRALSEADRHEVERVAATKVDFFTMVRGEDE
ncbi:phosphonate C-P lyase system protein PhnG [Notoacmeibacter marinus]|nr:phosphonate C-P lyase system protein PhnG [Notoacmeibacter marinus]